MTANLGTVDRLARLVVGLVLQLTPTFFASDIWTNPYALVGTYAVGVILAATALFRFCPLYRLFGLRTCRA